MAEPEKPFACSLPDCGMTFTNEDHLTVHTKKHDMYLQLGLEQKAAFVADQTPTPTRFIRNCEEVGLFQDLQNVNPFEEGFKRAMETCKHGLLSLENMPSTTSDDLHTPQMVFPMLDNGDSTLYTRNNQKNITISRSSSDESGTVKEYETTTISKLTNQVSTISRVVNKHDVAEKTSEDTNAKEDACQKEETSVSYTNNVIKIHNNIEIRKDNSINVDTTKNVPINIVSYADTVIKDAIITKDVLLATTKAHVENKVPPIMSQKSLDFVVESLTSDMCQNHNSKPEVKMRSRKCTKQLPKISPATKNLPNKTCAANIDIKTNSVGGKDEDYEVIIKLPNGKQVRMKAVEETNTPDNAKTENDTKEKLKLAINKKVSQKNNVYQRLSNITPIQGILPITGTLIPITIVNPTAQLVHKIPIAPYHHVTKPTQEFKKTVKRKTVISNSDNALSSAKCSDIQVDDDCVIVNDVGTSKKRSKEDLDTRVAASRRYRVRLRDTMRRQVTDIKQLKEANARLVAEKAVLKLLITEHMKRCPNAEDLRSTQEKLSRLPTDG